MLLFFIKQFPLNKPQTWQVSKTFQIWLTLKYQKIFPWYLLSTWHAR
jgi:hypothetical protein